MGLFELNKREIKFRAWDKLAKRFLYSYMPDEQPKRELIFQIFGIGFSNYNISDLIIMGYTGLYDSQGQEIREGDIIEYTGYFGTLEKGVIEWYLSGGRGVGDTETYLHEYFVWDNKDKSGKHLDVKVIGNVFENPQLLEATTDHTSF